MKSTIPGACLPACLPAGLAAGLLEILKIKPAQPPSWGWGLGLSLAKKLENVDQSFGSKQDYQPSINFNIKKSIS